MSVEWEDEEQQAMAVANEIGPQMVGQVTLVGARLIGMKTVQGVHSMIFDNGITATLKGTIKLEKSTPEDLGGGGMPELTGESISGHFKQLEAGGEDG